MFTNASGGTDTTPAGHRHPQPHRHRRRLRHHQRRPVHRRPAVRQRRPFRHATRASPATAPACPSTGPSTPFSPPRNAIFGPGWTTQPARQRPATGPQLTDTTGDYAALLPGMPTGPTTDVHRRAPPAAHVTWTPAGHHGHLGPDPDQEHQREHLHAHRRLRHRHRRSPSRASGGRYLPTERHPAGTARSTGFIYDSTSTDAGYGSRCSIVAPDAGHHQPHHRLPVPGHPRPPGPPGAEACSSATTRAGQRHRDRLRLPPTAPDLPPDRRSPTTATTLPGRLTTEWDPRLAPRW